MLPYTITVGHDVNDTELPGLEVDCKTRHIFRLAKNVFVVLPRGRAYETAMGASCKSRSWELVYTRPFTYHITLFQAQKREMKGLRMSERVTAGLISMIDTFKYIANVVARDRETIRREIRRILSTVAARCSFSLMTVISRVD